MKNMLMLGLYGLLILGASAGGTWFLRQQDAASRQAAGPDTEDAADGVQMPSTADLADHVDVTSPLPGDGPQELPVAVRPGEMSVEEIVRYGLGLKARESAIRKREEALRRTETQYRLVLADIESEQQEMEGLVVQARDQKAASEQLLTQAQKERAESLKLLKDLDEQKKQLQKELDDKQKKLDAERQKVSKASAVSQSVQPTVDRDANIKELVSVMEGLNPQVAAGVLRQFANDGKMDMAVEILAKLEERLAAKILDEMNDDKLVSEFAAKFLELKTPVRL